MTARARAATTGAAAYDLAQQALWHNCPDALEVALGLVQQETQRMEHKLRFTRIRQRFVALCHAFHSGGKSASIDEFRTQTSLVEKECVALIESQLQEQKNALPGLITRRDTILLHRRMQEVVKRIIASACRSRRRQRESSDGRDRSVRSAGSAGSLAGQAARRRSLPSGQAPRKPVLHAVQMRSTACHGALSCSSDSLSRDGTCPAARRPSAPCQDCLPGSPDNWVQQTLPSPCRAISVPCSSRSAAFHGAADCSTDACMRRLASDWEPPTWGKPATDQESASHEEMRGALPPNLHNFAWR